MATKITPDNDPRDYVGYNLLGYPFNCKYPPNKEKFGERFEGYATKGEGVLLYDFAVMGYDAEIVYLGKKYHLLNDGEAYLSDEHYTKHCEEFEDPMDLIENLKIEGKPLISILKELDDAEPIR